MALSENVSSSSKFTQTDSAANTILMDLVLWVSNILLYASNKKDMGKGLILLDSIFREPAPLNFNRTHNQIRQLRIPPIIFMLPILFRLPIIMKFLIIG